MLLLEILQELALFLLFGTALTAVIYYVRQQSLLALASIVVIAGIYKAFSALPLWVHFLIWLVVAAEILFLFVPEVRRNFVSNRVRDYLRRALPPISQTEREAIEAGTVWWEAELFSGQPNWARLLDAPPPALTEEEKEFLNNQTHELCEMIDDWETSTQYDLSESVWNYMRENRFFGMVIPREYGGLGFSAYAHALVVQKIASRSVTAGVTVMVPNSLGPGMLLLEYGTPEQKKHYLPRLAEGQEIPCFALTSAQAGSDAASMPDTGVVCRGQFEGKEIIGIRLNWDKRYITLAPVATVVGLAFQLHDPEGLLGDKQHPGITVALIPAETPGVEIGKRHIPMNTPFMNGPIRGKDVFIPLDWIIGGQEQAGQGWRMLMECLSEGRAISLPALSVAAAKYCCFATGAYARVRTQFRLPISAFEGIAEPLAEIAGETYLMIAVSNITAAAIDAGEKPAVASAISKYHLTEKMRKLTNHAMDIHAGSGICIGKRNQIGRIYQSVPIAITVEGANILTRSMIIFGQGAIRCHPWLYREMQAAQDTEKYSLDDFDDLLAGHIDSLFGNAAAAFLLALSGGLLARNIPPQAPLKKHFRKLSQLSAAFALVADYALLRLGSQFKRKEHISGLLGDMLSELYLASACLKHFCNAGCLSEQIVLVDWVVKECVNRFHRAMFNLLDNLPGGLLLWKIRFLVYPYGKPRITRDEDTIRKVADTICSLGAVRKQLTRGVFVSSKKDDPLVQLEDALNKAIAAYLPEKKMYKLQREHKIEGTVEHLIKTLRQQNLMSEDELKLVEAAHEARLKVIEVDEFSKELWKVS